MAFDFPNAPALNQIFTPAGGNRSYYWDGIAWLSGSGPGSAAAAYVLKTGDTMTGPLTLPGDPTAPLHATPKQYVDAKALPLGGNPGEALVKSNPANTPTWGAVVDAGNF